MKLDALTEGGWHPNQRTMAAVLQADTADCLVCLYLCEGDRERERERERVCEKESVFVCV